MFLLVDYAVNLYLLVMIVVKILEVCLSGFDFAGIVKNTTENWLVSTFDILLFKLLVKSYLYH